LHRPRIKRLSALADVAAAKLLWCKLNCPATVNVEHHAGQQRYPCIEYPPSLGSPHP
jgi:hypothetical protein